jgi:hypothetical protein
MDRYHGQQIHKRLSAFPVIDHADLDLSSSLYLFFQTQDCLIIHVFSFHSRVNFAVGRLQESTVSTEDFMFGIAGKPLKRIGHVNDGVVMGSYIAKNERTRHVDGADIYLRVWSTCYFGLDALS